MLAQEWVKECDEGEMHVWLKSGSESHEKLHQALLVMVSSKQGSILSTLPWRFRKSELILNRIHLGEKIINSLSCILAQTVKMT